jgi:hypothetical protein
MPASLHYPECATTRVAKRPQWPLVTCWARHGRVAAKFSQRREGLQVLSWAYARAWVLLTAQFWPRGSRPSHHDRGVPQGEYQERSRPRALHPGWCRARGRDRARRRRSYLRVSYGTASREQFMD